MSHNSKSYRKKITKRASEKCKKIDVLFKLQKIDEGCASTSTDNVCTDSHKDHDHESDEEIGVEHAKSSTNTECDADVGSDDDDDDYGDDDDDNFKEKDCAVPDRRLFASSTYENLYKWLYFSSAKTGYCCKYCEYYYTKTNSVTPENIAYVSRGVSLGSHPSRRLKKHESSNSHKEAEKSYHFNLTSKLPQNSVLQMLQKMQAKDEADQEKNRKYLEVLFKSAYFIIRNRWALTDNLEDMVKNFLGKDLQQPDVLDYIKRNPGVTYTSPSSIDQILKSISYAFENEVLENLKKATCYALLADESTDESNRQEFAILVRFLCSENFTIREEFLGLIHVERCDAESLMKAIEVFLLGKGVDIKKAIFVGFDGCNTMSGENKGLQRRFRHHVPHQLYINCRNHRLALCVKHLVKNYPILGELDELLLALWKLFKFSPQRYNVLKEVQQSYGLKELKCILAAATRWLSHGKACARLLDRYVSILDTLDALYDRKKQPELLGIRDMLTDKNKIAAAAVLCDMLQPVTIFSDYLQGDVNFSRMNSKVKDLSDNLHNLIERFQCVSNGGHDDLYVSKLDQIFVEIDDRTVFARRLRNVGIFSVHQFMKEVAIPVVYSLLQEIEDGFHCPPVLKSFSLFDINQVPTTVVEAADPDYGKTEIQALADHYGVMKEDVFMGHRMEQEPLFLKDSIIREFEGFKHQLCLLSSFPRYCYITSTRGMIGQRATPEDCQNHGHLLKMVFEDAILQRSYPSMAYLLLLSCLIPSSTACVERVFSVMNTICIPLRASMKPSTLDSLMRIYLLGDLQLTEKQLDSAVNFFMGLKKRIINL